jgi:hypothetical protein
MNPELFDIDQKRQELPSLTFDSLINIGSRHSGLYY